MRKVGDKMSTSVLLACELHEQKLPNFVLIRENIGADGSFMIVSILGQCLKYPNNAVVFVCMHHTSQHYTNSAARLGFNMNMAKEKGKIVILEPLSDIGKQLFESSYVKDSKTNTLNNLFNEIKENIEQQLQVKENVTIVIDSLTTFIDLGFEKNLIVRFCNKLIELASSRVSIVLKINVCSLFDDVVNKIEDYADSVITVSKLKSGEFQEVDGQIVYEKRSELCDHTTKTILYKVGDKNIKIFQPGEIGMRS